MSSQGKTGEIHRRGTGCPRKKKSIGSIKKVERERREEREANRRMGG